ncbi:glycoside hydrolase family 19 protein [Massilia horti]|uniref:Glycoside hydrolase family 19 protein n=1 Tax=Massilia horti TaxID=2562153 RepID=A0A4Y9T2P1_9BURK|nr:glycoside hydrolase family 19 protein [Massilia horti]TFW33389.1 glycoside hydrolase family 19 protein [Massilia horti]
MAVCVTVDQLARLAPQMRPGYREAFQIGQGVLDHWGISATPRRVAHFLAQVLHESQALTVEYENLSYSAQRLAQVWPARFRPHGPLDPGAYARNPRKLANLVYGGRMGNTRPDDGYTFRGRGLLQLTGRDAYARVTALLRAAAAGQAPGQPAGTVPDFVARPDAVLDPCWCLEVACAMWCDKGCNELADDDDLDQLTRRINGADNGLAERGEWCRSAGEIWC